MVSKTFLATLLLATSLSLANLSAQDSDCARRTVPVGVVDREWSFVPGLSASNFRGWLRGRDVEVLSTTIDTGPRHIVLLLDASGSIMHPDTVWDGMKSLSEDLIRYGPPQSFIAQMAFSESVLWATGFDQDRSLLLRHQAALFMACEQPRKNRRTALIDSIASALGTYRALGPGNVIYIVTDAWDNQSDTEPKTVEEGLLQARVRLFAVVVDEASGPLRGLDHGIGPRQRFFLMVQTTGGNLLDLPPGRASYPVPLSRIKAETKSEVLGLAIRRLYQQMGKFYRLDLRLPADVRKPTELELEVRDENGKPNRRVEVHYPHKLMPCTTASP